MRALAWTELFAIWILWFWSYLFRAPKVQKRKSITVRGPSLVGVALETAGIFVPAFFRVPDPPRTSAAPMLVALFFGAIAIWLMWTAVTHLGRQFRIQAGLYEDHQLVRTGPYALVRHPIYASLLALALVTGILLGRWESTVTGVVLCVAGNEIRVHTEDRLLEGRFGEEFRKYRKKVRAYVPLVR
jgi:protein-S-isoprenylcysteine O-methyltransferase Ste14